MHPNGGIKWEGNLMPLPWWGGSVAEAIFLIGAERNGDRIIGACYVGLPSKCSIGHVLTNFYRLQDSAASTGGSGP